MRLVPNEISLTLCASDIFTPYKFYDWKYAVWTWLSEILDPFLWKFVYRYQQQFIPCSDNFTRQRFMTFQATLETEIKATFALYAFCRTVGLDNKFTARCRAKAKSLVWCHVSVDDHSLILFLALLSQMRLNQIIVENQITLKTGTFYNAALSIISHLFTQIFLDAGTAEFMVTIKENNLTQTSVN